MGGPSDFVVEEACRGISGFSNWDKYGVSNGFIHDGILTILYKFIAYNISGNEQANKVNVNEVYLLYAAMTGEKVCLTSFIWCQMDVIVKRSLCHPTFTIISTDLFRHLCQVSEEKVPCSILPTRRVDLIELGNGHLIMDKSMFVQFHNRPCVKEYLSAQAVQEREMVEDPDREDEVDHGDASFHPNVFQPAH